jgi:pimeloyl-ACP methyl ester carboxylesterase
MESPSLGVRLEHFSRSVEGRMTPEKSPLMVALGLSGQTSAMLRLLHANVLAAIALGTLFASCGGAGDAPPATDGQAPIDSPTEGGGDQPSLPGEVDEAPAPEDGAPPKDQDWAELDMQASATIPGWRYRVRYVPGYPSILEFVVNNTGSGYVERFLVQPATGSQPAPLLVVFHKYSASHADLLNTTFPTEAAARNWHVMSPLGARGKHFGNLESQINTQIAIDLVMSLWPVDRQRIYGVGFSMGGGAGANYAARHVDPSRAMFAAFVNHTGGMSLENVWSNAYDDLDGDDNTPNVGENLEAPDLLESFFGGAPAQSPFGYARCSTVQLDAATTQVLPTFDFARNLAHVPLLNWRVANEPLDTQYLANGLALFHQHQAPRNPANAEVVAPGNLHRWNTLDANAACNFLAQHTLSVPTSGDTLADEDGVWFRFIVAQAQQGAFTRLRWRVDGQHPTGKLIEVLDTHNLARAQISSQQAGFSFQGPMVVRLSAADGQADQVLLTGVDNPPAFFLRDGAFVLAGAWIHDAQARTLLIVETDPGLHEYTFQLN